MGRRFAAAPNFLTMAVDDVNSPTAFRLSYYSTNNVDWPALAPEGFFEAMERGSTYQGSGDVSVDCSWPALAAAATEGPVSVAVAYKQLVHNVLTILVGLRPANSRSGTKKTEYKSWSNVGAIVGTPLGYIGVTETTARGSLHFHVVIWGGLSPELLESISTIPELCAEASKILESMYSASLPREVHVRDLVSREISRYVSSHKHLSGHKRTRCTGRAMLIPPDPTAEKTLEDFAHCTAAYTNMHRHVMTCRKGNKGYAGCRLAMPKGKRQRTEPVELLDTTPKGQSAQPKWVVKDCITERSGHPVPAKDQLEPFHDLDPRIIVWEIKRELLQRLPPSSSLPDDRTLDPDHRKWLIDVLCEAMDWSPEGKPQPPHPDEDDDSECKFSCPTGNFLNDQTIIRETVHRFETMDLADLHQMYSQVCDALEKRNGFVAEYNILLTALLGCNTNSVFLGSREQSKGAVFYIGPYMCKNLVEIIDSFDLLLEAQDHARRYPSRAEDSSSNKRFVQYVVTRVLNKLNALIEVSDSQAAAGLLGMEAGMCSERFWVYDAKSYINYTWDDVAQNLKDGIFGSADTVSSSGSEEDDDEYISTDESFISTDESMSFTNTHVGPPPEDCTMDGSDESDVAPADTDSLGHNTPPDEIRVVERCPNLSCPFEDSFNSDGRYGSCRVYHIDNDIALWPVPYPAFYRFRGERLKMLNRYEYCCIVEVKKITKQTGTGNDPRGRKKNARFDFGEKFPLRFSHHQALRSKQCTLKLFSNPPPHPGGKPPASAPPADLERWKRRADKFAMYYLVLFRPEDKIYNGEHVNNLQYDWATFEEFCKELTRSPKQIDRLRFEIMERFVHGWRTKASNRLLLSAYRARDRDEWSKKEQSEARDFFGDAGSGDRRSNFEQDDVFNESLDCDLAGSLSPGEERQIMAAVAFSDADISPPHAAYAVETSPPNPDLAAHLLDALPPLPCVPRARCRPYEDTPPIFSRPLLAPSCTRGYSARTPSSAVQSPHDP